MMRDYEYIQQRVHLEVDVLGKYVKGHSETILAPKVGILPTVRLHARQLNVQKVLVNDVEAKFEHLNFMQNIVREEYRDLRAFDLFYRGTIVASKEGELIIYMPSNVKITPVDTATSLENVGTLGNTTTEAKWDLDVIPPSTTNFQCISVKVEYEIKNPDGGLRFMLPDESSPYRSPHMYTFCGPYGGLCDGARTWMPCHDTLRDTCPFRLELKVPLAYAGISGGTLVQQIIDPTETYRSFRYVINHPTTASSIGFAVGPFKMYISEEYSSMTHFCLPEAYEEITHTISSTHKAMRFYEQTLNSSYPFGSYQQIFVEDPSDDLQWFAGLSILNQSVLHKSTVIDPELNSHVIQAKGIIGSWIGCGVGLHTSKDAWVLTGLVGHLVNIYIRSVYGEEEYGYRIRLAMDALTTLELTTKGKSPALLSSEVDVYEEYTPSSLPFLEVKAPLVMHMIEQKVGVKHLMTAIQQVVCGSVSDIANSLVAGSTSNGINEDGSNVGNGLPPSSMSGTSNLGEEEGDEHDNDADQSSSSKSSTRALSTLPFLRIVKTIAGSSGQDLTKNFLSYWILEGGMPLFTIGFWYNRKQTQAEVVLQQEIPPGGKMYTGYINVTIVEDTGEHLYKKRIESKRHKWDFPCHGKVRKKRRKRQGLDDPDDSVSVVGPGMGLNDTPVYWVKVDAEFGWLRHVVMHQPDFNWMEQLLSEKKALSRFQAVRALSLFHQPHEKPNVMSCRVITECMSGLTTHSSRLRTEAALALGNWQTIHAPITNANTHFSIWKGMHNLFRIFKEHFYDREKDMPLPNYFVASGGRVVLEAVGLEDDQTPSSNIEVQEYAEGEYEIKKAIPRSLASIHAQDGHSPPEIESFLLQLLTENDNSKNYVRMDDQSQVVDDCYYLGTIIISLSLLKLDPKRAKGSTASTSRREESSAATEIMRCLNYDQVSPSYRHVVTVCCLEALCNLKLSGRCNEDVPFYQYATPKNETSVRKAAVESIIRLYMAENPNVKPETIGSTSSSHRSMSQENISGCLAAFQWVTQLLEIEESPNLRLFTVNALSNACKGFPPRVAIETLATWQHPYIVSFHSKIISMYPKVFLSESPVKSTVLKCFTPVSLHPLTENSRQAREIVERFWKLLNDGTEYDQRLRVSLILLYRYVWGDSTPLSVAQSVDNKPPNWAGGYESLRLMIENKRQSSQDSNSSTLLNGRSTPSNDKWNASVDKRPRAFLSGTTLKPPRIGNSIEDFKGKKFKLTIGDQVVRSDRL